MRSVRLPIAVVVAISAGGGAWAQGQPGAVIDSNIRRKPVQIGENKAGPLRKEFARCAYRRRQAVLDGMLQHSDPMTIEDKVMKAHSLAFERGSAMSECLAEASDVTAVDTRMSFSPQNLRGLFLEEAYLARLPAAREPVGLAAIRVYVSPAKTVPQARGLGEYADCIVARDHAGADRLLRTMPGSDQERQVAGGLVPILRACLTNGQTITLTPASIRAMAADGLWQRYVASPSTSVTAAATMAGQR